MGREVLNEAYGVSKGGWVVTGVRDGVIPPRGLSRLRWGTR